MKKIQNLLVLVNKNLSITNKRNVSHHFEGQYGERFNWV